MHEDIKAKLASIASIVNQEEQFDDQGYNCNNYFLGAYKCPMEGLIFSLRRTLYTILQILAAAPNRTSSAGVSPDPYQ